VCVWVWAGHGGGEYLETRRNKITDRVYGELRSAVCVTCVHQWQPTA